LPPRTLGEHLKRVRQIRELLQRQVAAEIGVGPETLANWEKDRTSPSVIYMPAVVAFLGYDPTAHASTLQGRMLAYRKHHGLTVDAAARRLGVDPGTWGDWERGGVVPWPRYKVMLERLLST